MTTSAPSGIDVGGRTINLGQLEGELQAGGVTIANGLILAGPGATPGEAREVALPSGTLLFAADASGQVIDLPVEAAAIVDAHVAMRPKTDAEYSAEFQDAATTVARKQEIRDIMAGLLPRELVAM